MTNSSSEILHDNRDEMIDIVDENDNVLGAATKDYVYKNNLRKRVANIVVIDPVTKKIALQKRGLNVSWQPDHYAVSACGHVGTGESWETGAARELKEEMGIETDLHFIGKMSFTCAWGKPFILGNFIAYVSHDALRPDPREVYQVLSLEPSEVRGILNRGEKLQNIFAPVISQVLEYIK